MEFANGGDISGYLKENGAMSEPVACYWFTQASSAIAYMHDEVHMAHRDIKIDNVLLHNNKAKVTDFGFARNVQDENGNIIFSTTFCGTEAIRHIISSHSWPFFAFRYPAVLLSADCQQKTLQSVLCRRLGNGSVVDDILYGVPDSLLCLLPIRCYAFLYAQQQVSLSLGRREGFVPRAHDRGLHQEAVR